MKTKKVKDKAIGKKRRPGRPKGSYKLTKIQRESVVREHIVEGISLRDIAKRLGFHPSSIWSLVNKSDKLNSYKKERDANHTQAMATLYDRASKRAIDQAHRLTPYQAVTATGISWDKLHPQTSSINVGDNRKLNVTFTNWGASRGGTPSGTKAKGRRFNKRGKP